MFPDIPSISGVIPEIFNPAEFMFNVPFIFGNSRGLWLRLWLRLLEAAPWPCGLLEAAPSPSGLSGREVFRAKFNLPEPFLTSMGYFNLNLSFNVFWIAARFMSWEDKVKFRVGDLKSVKEPRTLYPVSKQLKFTASQLAWS